MPRASHRGIVSVVPKVVSKAPIGVLTLLLLMAPSAQAVVNGIASYQLFGKERYLAVLHTPSSTSESDQLLALASNNISDGLRMEYVITAESLSQRSFSRSLLESVTINNSERAVNQHGQSLVKLIGLFKGRLIQGDSLVFSRGAGQVQVQLNQVLLGAVADGGMFALLVNTWLGEVPPSREFRQALLVAGAIEENLANRYAQASPRPGRAQEIAQNWLAPKTSPAPAPRPAPEPKPQVALAREQVAAATVTPRAVQPEQRAAPRSQPPAPAAPSSPEDSTKPNTAPSVVVADATPATVRRPESNLAQSQPSVAESQPVARIQSAAEPEAPARSQNNQVATAQLPSESERQSAPAEPAFDLASLQLTRQYYQQVKNAIYREVVYPRTALRLGRESDVGLNVRIDQQGEVSEVSISSPSEFDYFNRSALRAVKDAKPFAVPPDAVLDDGEYEFTMQLNFRITD